MVVAVGTLGDSQAREEVAASEACCIEGQAGVSRLAEREDPIDSAAGPIVAAEDPIVDFAEVADRCTEGTAGIGLERGRRKEGTAGEDTGCRCSVAAGRHTLVRGSLLRLHLHLHLDVSRSTP